MTQIPISYDQSAINKLDKQLFSKWLIAWYRTHKRHLPWRNTDDPYKIWLSEIILQQTRVAQGLPYYERFIEQYPTIHDLAHAPDEAVLRLWQGLGYYSRARNLLACARMVVEHHQGHFPDHYQALLQLPGIGTYTAAAIASIAFKEAVPVVDGNVYRVLARIFGIDADMSSHQGKKIFRELAYQLIPQQKADEYNQAIMDFGATQCTPRQPQCITCIFKNHCIAFQTNRQLSLPVKTASIKIKKRFFHYLVIQTNEHIYMRLRKDTDIWKGLYDFYLIESTALAEELHALADELVDLIKAHQLSVSKSHKVYQHILTHQRLYVHFFYIQANTSFLKAANHLLEKHHNKAFPLSHTKNLPKPILIHTFLEKELYC